jgi:hypothetical protein
MIGLLTKKGSYAVDSLLASGQIDLNSIDLSELNNFSYLCHYNLPKIKSGELVLIVSGFLHEINNVGISSEQLVRFLRQRFEKIFLLDQADPFQLDFPEDTLILFDEILKVNGVYKDPDLYNYQVGAPTPDGNWTYKIKKGDFQYTPEIVNKINLSIPCFLGVVPELRGEIRKYYQPSFVRRTAIKVIENFESFLPKKLNPSCPPEFTVHFYGSLTHIQRANAVEKLQNSGIKYFGGITSIPLYITGRKGVGISKIDEIERKNVVDELQKLMVAPLNRYSYQQSMQQCKAVLSITGYGELCFRMAEAWKNRRILVCQDLSHVKTLFPFENMKNVVYCKPDLSDLIDVLTDIEENFHNYIQIAEQGYQDWIFIERNWQTYVKEGFLPILESSKSLI